MNIQLSLMAGIDIPIPECQLIIHQPTIYEIALLGEQKFFQSIQCLAINKNSFSQDEIVSSDLNNFQIFMMIMNEKETQDKKFNIIELFSILCPEYKISFLPQSIIFSKGEEKVLIDESNFEFLQETIKEIFCLNSSLNKEQVYNPGNKKAKEIMDKIMRGRQRVAAQKNGENSSIFSQYLSVLTVGIASMSLKDALDLTMFQMFDLIERYGLYTAWDIDIKSRLAGAQIDKPPENWMKNIH